MTRQRFRPRNRTLAVKVFYQRLAFIIRLTKGNYSQVAKILGVSRNTLINWHTNKTPPTGWYWCLVLDKAILETIEDMTNSSLRDIKQQARLYRIEYGQQPGKEDSIEDISQSGITQCQQYLLSLFAERPLLNSRWLRKEGRYSHVQVKYAAEGLGLTITTNGFGEDKSTTYSLPKDPLA